MIFNAICFEFRFYTILKQWIFKINNLIILICILYFTTVGDCNITFTYKLPGYIVSKWELRSYDNRIKLYWKVHP